MGKNRRSLKWKFVLLCMVALISVLTVVHLVVYVTTRNVVEEQIKVNAQGIAVAVAHNLMEDIEEYKSFTKKFVDIDKIELENPDCPKYFDDPYYKRKQVYFAELKTNGNIKYIATERKIGEGKEFEYLLDADPVGSEGHSAPKDIDPMTPQRESVYESKRAAGFDLVHDKQWGHLIEGFAPIFDCDENGKRGEMLGIVGVSIGVSELHNRLNTVQVTLFLIYAVIIGMALMTLPKYSDAVLGQMSEDKFQEPTDSAIMNN
jgi:hypothetical protein